MNFKLLNEKIKKYIELIIKSNSIKQIINIKNAGSIVDKKELQKKLFEYKIELSKLNSLFKNKNFFVVELGTLFDTIKAKIPTIKSFVFYSSYDSSTHTSVDFYGNTTSSHNTYFYSFIKNNLSFTPNRKEIEESINNGDLILLSDFCKFEPYSSGGCDISLLIDRKNNFRDIKINFFPSKDNPRAFSNFPLISILENKYFETFPNMLNILVETIQKQQRKNNEREINQTRQEIKSLEDNLKEKNKKLEKLNNQSL